MGALHEGHASLLRRARAECEAVAATIFVNPMQFGPAEDLERYPRTLEADLDVLARAGADAVYLPAVPEVYPPGFATRVVPEGPAEGLEGNRRPGHFAGVATVVLKLWLAMRPDRIYFGRKDAQQVAVVRRMARDLDLPGRIVVGPTVRDPDGLALSSRNRYLTPPEREQALALPRALEALVLEAWTTPDDAEAPVARARSEMEACGLDVDYVALVDPDTMRPAAASGDPELAVAAARIGRTRLLDNRWVIRRPAGGAP
jgi:pantoate--beta-alanine ligase